MKWIDYREKLGIGFNDKQKFQALSNIFRNYAEVVFENSYNAESYLRYCQMVGEPYLRSNCLCHNLSYSFGNCKSTEELIAHFIAFYNTYKPNLTQTYPKVVTKKEVITFLKDTLTKTNIMYELCKDDDGFFVFPKGASELDDALVSEPLEWLREYPNARKTFCNALKQYSDGIYIRDAADNLRKALEEFLQEFLKNGKNLETNKNAICSYLGDHNVDPGISGLFQQLINTYKNLNDKTAKHNDAIDKHLLEFVLYQTGILIRMVISVNKSEGDTNAS